MTHGKINKNSGTPPTNVPSTSKDTLSSPNSPRRNARAVASTGADRLYSSSAGFSSSSTTDRTTIKSLFGSKLIQGYCQRVWSSRLTDAHMYSSVAVYRAQPVVKLGTEVNWLAAEMTWPTSYPVLYVYVTHHVVHLARGLEVVSKVTNSAAHEWHYD